jgi:hypothetical protein
VIKYGPNFHLTFAKTVLKRKFFFQDLKRPNHFILANNFSFKKCQLATFVGRQYHGCQVPKNKKRPNLALSSFKKGRIHKWGKMPNKGHFFKENLPNYIK